jgi:hypothetical protein
VSNKPIVRYKRVYDPKTGKQVGEHIMAWRSRFGEIPKGLELHHIDGDKRNNAISNLMLVTRTEHSRIHAGWEYIDGIWYRPCNMCERYLPLDRFNNRLYDKANSNETYVGGVCKDCRHTIMTSETGRARWKLYTSYWMEHNKERRNETQRAWRAKNPEKTKEYKQRISPDKIAAYNATRRATYAQTHAK